MTDRKEMVEDVMKDAYGCASFNVQCGKCKETTIVYVLPGSILKRIEDAVPLERAQAAAIAAASVVRSTDEKWEHAPIGNAAALREACVNIVEYARSARCHTDDAHVLGFLDQIERWAQAALDAPPRNCDKQGCASLDALERACEEVLDAGSLKAVIVAKRRIENGTKATA